MVIHGVPPAARRASVLAFALIAAAAPLAAQEGALGPRAVETVEAARSEQAPVVALTGELAARVQSDLGFRIQGRIAERSVEVGDRVVAGQVLARLENSQQLAEVASQQAGLAAAEATLKNASATFDRQKALLAQGFTTQSSFDGARQAYESARSSLSGAKAALQTAEDALSFTDLKADADGIVTARGAEVGQVVAVAQSVFTVAQDGPRDAIFDVPESVIAQSPQDKGAGDIEIVLVSDRSVTARGRVREISPAIDLAKGTVRVKVSLEATPPAMRLGAPVIGRARMMPRPVVVLPWQAFFSRGTTPAVWVVDRATRAVSLRPIQVDSYRTGEIVVGGGIEPGELVVSAGAQFLRQGEVVAPVAGRGSR
ncbi:RND family efflux transporter MFP subunit [Bosea sp. OAE506]|uniref:efflux RND transporter periplasmic adaptor subunit n=1 Tax=Bosea sp. OAE506 TaxID=2663870 RepID=UPI0019FBB565